jgi:hypothetical protein
VKINAERVTIAGAGILGLAALVLLERRAPSVLTNLVAIAFGIFALTGGLLGREDPEDLSAIAWWGRGFSWVLIIGGAGLIIGSLIALYEGR